MRAVYGSLVLAILLISLCKALVAFARGSLPNFSPFHVTAVKPADSELLTFLLAYLLPLVNIAGTRIDWWVLGFVVLLVVGVVWATHAYYYNPVLALFRYHFYEVTSDGGVTYMVLSNRTLRSASDLVSVKQLSAYVLMDAATSGGTR